MAERPIFIPNEYGTRYVTIEKVKFDWYPGFSIAQKQKSIDFVFKV